MQQAAGITNLFGGALQCLIPVGFVDISQFRQVPDNQEVFADANKDQSICIEIVERINLEDNKIGHFYFHALAKDSDADEVCMLDEKLLNKQEVPLIQETVVFCQGAMKISKGRQGMDAANTVQVYFFSMQC